MSTHNIYFCEKNKKNINIFWLEKSALSGGMSTLLLFYMYLKGIGHAWRFPCHFTKGEFATLLCFGHPSEIRFYLMFYSVKLLNWFVIKNILSETICCFCSSAWFPNIYCKFFMAKNGSDLCNFCSELDFWKFFIKKKYFLFFFFNFKLLMFHHNIVKISEGLNKRSLLKVCIKTPCPIDFCIFCNHFYYWKK